MNKQTFRADRILSYFKEEWGVLAIITVSGLIYNIGLLAGPWFEGRMAGCLIEILKGRQDFFDMLRLVLAYVLAIAVVQGTRYMKRFYVRRFSNNVNRRMKQILYASLVRKSRAQLNEQGAGNVMTKAILDVDDCAEGMRKFTTEIFDTGIALAAYAGMLLYYDWRLALLSMLFPPVSYILAERMKVVVQRTGTVYKEQSGALNSATLDMASNSLTYRVFGREQQRQQAYEERLAAYEKSAVRANIWNAAMPPVYRIVSMCGLMVILYFGSKNVLGTGWTSFSIAVFTTFISCFTKLSIKSSSAAKLFNAVHKAQVSWKRIRPLMRVEEDDSKEKDFPVTSMSVKQLGFVYPDGHRALEAISFDAEPGQMIGVTGTVASGKSTFGKVFLCEYPYEGSIRLSGRELGDMTLSEQRTAIGYLGHDPELFNDTIENNILMGTQDDAMKYLKMVCLDEEVEAMEDGLQTIVGNGGVRLSGGQAQRLALARTLCHKKPVLILDDPFSALDRKTEEQIFASLKDCMKDGIVILMSHRLYLFPEMEQVLWLADGRAFVGTHEEVREAVCEYRDLYESQDAGLHKERSCKDEG